MIMAAFFGGVFTRALFVPCAYAFIYGVHGLWGENGNPHTHYNSKQKDHTHDQG